MLNVLVLLLMTTAILWPAYRVVRPSSVSVRRTTRNTSPATSPIQHPSVRTPAPEEPALLAGRLDDYVHGGLVDLRIMLAQEARRGLD